MAKAYFWHDEPVAIQKSCHFLFGVWIYCSISELTESGNA